MLNLYYEYIAEEAMNDAIEAAEAEAAERAALEAERAALEAEEDAIREEEEERMRADLRQLAAIGDWDVYSDIFKDLYGFRPRDDAWHWYDN